jgi:hypothetical protein
MLDLNGAATSPKNVNSLSNVQIETGGTIQGKKTSSTNLERKKNKNMGDL